MKKLLCAIGMLMSTALLVSCGGGGGGGGAAEAPKTLRITVTTQDARLPSNRSLFSPAPGSQYTTTISARVTQASGAAVADGTAVTFSVSPSNLAMLSTPDSFAADGEVTRIAVGSTGGNAEVTLNTQADTGDVTITASVQDPNSNQTSTATVVVGIDEGPEPEPRVKIESVRTVLPANSFNVAPFFGSPYVTTVTLSYRDEFGVLAQPTDGEMGVSINPVDIAAFSTLDDPQTQDINEFFSLLGNAPVDIAGGKGTVFIHTFDRPGEVTLSVTAIDPTDGENLANELTFTVSESASDGQPANVTIQPDGQPQYVQGSGGRTAASFQVFVSDAGDTPVADPSGANPPFNNLRLSIQPGNGSDGASLSGVDGTGANVRGEEISVASIGGIVSAALTSGNEAGNITVRATADRADNNVDNGIQDPVTASNGFVVSDGQLFSVKITSPDVNALTVNRVNPNQVLEGNDAENIIPPDPNATYSLTVSAIATDRSGNPPAQPIEIGFRLVDAPLVGYPNQGSGVFAMSGADGNAVEGGTGFTAPTGAFVTAGGGAGPGDTLIIFGEDVPGNSDLEGARIVDVVNGETSLNVTSDFNLNDTTGTSVNNGNVLPYLIGRARNGNIDGAGLTDANGVATVQMNFPVSQLGRTVAIVAQATSDQPSNTVETVSDAELLVYPGLAPATLSAAPGSIPSNVTVDVLVCLQDAALSPIQGVYIGFSYAGISGTGFVDEQANAGTVVNPTGADGCTVAVARTTGQVSGGTDGVLTFVAGAATAEVEVVAPGSTVLTANPSAFFGEVNNAQILLTLYDGAGNPVEGAAINGTCEAEPGSLGIVAGPTVTDENGNSFAAISAEGFNRRVPADEIGQGTCTFSTSTGDASAEVNVLGRDACAGDFSPRCDDPSTGGGGS